MKNDDLQGIRAVAIVFVVAFHLRPELFPDGYVGVDMFFVLSGYLMSMILSREDLNIRTVKHFYVKRFIRIVPVFYVTMAIIYAVVFTILISSDRMQFIKDMQWAATFTTNMQPLFEVKGYWDQLASYRFWLHAWSLGVEIQFYLLAPLLLGATKKLEFRMRMSLFVIVATISITLQSFSSVNISHGLLFCRMWQFLLGSIVFETKNLSGEPKYSLLQVKNDKEHLLEEKVLPEKSVEEIQQEHYYSPMNMLRDLLLLSLLLYVGMGNQWLSLQLMRLLITLCTAILIWFSNTSNPHFFLSSRIFVYLGNVSYSLYLLHWPIMVIIKYQYNLKEIVGHNLWVTTLIIAAATIFFYHVIEKFLIRLSFLKALWVCIICVLFVFLSLPKFNIYEPKFEDLDSIIRINTYESGKMYYDIHCGNDTVTMAWTNFTEEPQLRCQNYGSGTARILVLGNSIAYRAFPLIDSILKGRYKELRLYSKSSCTPIANECQFTSAAKITVDKMRPDIIFLIYTKNEALFVGPILDLKTDPMFKVMQANIDYYSNRTKHLVIELPYYVASPTVSIGAYQIVKRLQQNISLTDLKVSKAEAELQQKWHIARLKALNCNNCLYMPTNEAIYEGDTFYFYNRSSLLAYTKEGEHFTDEGLKLIRNTYEATIEKVLGMYQNGL